MPADTAIAAAEQFRAAVLSKQRASLVRLVNGYGAMYQRLQTQIDALTAEIDTMALKGDVTPWKVGKLDRLEALKRQIADEATRYGALVEGEIDAGAREMVAQAQRDAKTIARAALPGVQQIDAAIMTQWQSLNPEAVQSLLGFLSDESPMRDYLRTKFGPELSNVVSSKMLESIGLGYNPRKLASALRQATGQGLDWSLRTARTAQLYAYREGSRAAYAANPDVVKGWKWLSARTSNTCLSCIAQDGTIHPLSEPLADHYNGKCSILPQTVTYRELGLDVDEPPSALEHVTGEDWFKAQPESVQRQMMGPAKHDAWKSGKVPFDRLTTEHTDPVYGKMKSERSLKDILGGDDGGAPSAPRPRPPEGPPPAQLGDLNTEAFNAAAKGLNPQSFKGPWGSGQPIARWQEYSYDVLDGKVDPRSIKPKSDEARVALAIAEMGKSQPQTLLRGMRLPDAEVDRIKDLWSKGDPYTLPLSSFSKDESTAQSFARWGQAANTDWHSVIVEARNARAFDFQNNWELVSMGRFRVADIVQDGDAKTLRLILEAS